MPRRTATTLATLSALIAAPLLWAGPAALAGLVTFCSGTGGAVTVPNDLVVASGDSCSLEGTTVTGNVRVADGGNLVVAGGTINGEVQVGSNGYLDATDTAIDGQVVLAPGGYGVFLRDSRTGRLTLQPKGSATIEGFLFVENTVVDGTVTAGVGEVRLDRTTQVTGDVNSSGAFYTDVHDSFVDGGLSVLNNATGSVVCGSAVQGRATFAGNLGGVQLGPNGTLDGCAAGGYWARDVSITNTRGGVTVDDNIVNGQLRLSGNDPAARVAANNRIRGGVVGEQTARAAARAAAGADREATGDRRASSRRAAAVGAATAAGDARL
jgi:cytoskeletal protein CcmA (bactofilin family)